MSTLAVIAAVLLLVIGLIVLLINRAARSAVAEEREKNAAEIIEAQELYQTVINRPAPASDADRAERWRNLGLYDN